MPKITSWDFIADTTASIPDLTNDEVTVFAEDSGDDYMGKFVVILLEQDMPDGSRRQVVQYLRTYEVPALIDALNVAIRVTKEQSVQVPHYHDTHTETVYVEPENDIESEEDIDMRNNMPEVGEFEVDDPDVKYPHIAVQLAGEDGNAFSIIGRVSTALRHGKVSREEIEAYCTEAMSGDYDNLLQTTMRWVSVH